MKIKVVIFSVLLLPLFIMQMQCKIVSWEEKNLIVNTAIERTFDVNTSNTSFSESEVVNLASELADAGVDLGGYEIDSSKVTDIQILIIELTQGQGATFRDMEFSYRKVTPPQVYKNLVSWNSNNSHTLLSILNSPMNAYNQLTIDADGKSTLEGFFSMSPAPNVSFLFEMYDVAGVPVKFKVTVTIKIQLILKSTS